MSDALLGVLIGALVGVVGNLITYRVARLNSRDDENRRREARIDSERTIRREDYRMLNWMLARLHKYGAMGDAPTMEDWKDWLDYYAFWSGAVSIVASDGVVRRVNEFTGVIEKYSFEFLRGAEKGHWQRVYAEHAEEIENVRRDLVASMKEDVQLRTEADSTSARSLL